MARVGDVNGMRFVRRHLVQVAALTVAVGVVVVLGVMALRPSGGSQGAGAVRPSVVARATATADPRVDAVKAVARRFIEAFWESAKTGDTTAVDALTQPDTQAYGNAGINVTISKSEHDNFIASRIDFDELSWHLDVLSEHASVDVAYRLYGHDADWPSLRAREPDHESKVLRADFQLELVGSKWLVTKYN
jgi:hypothetical protein